MRKIRSAAAFLACLLVAGVAQSATRTWSGAAGNGQLMDPANWQGGIAPTSSDRIAFPEVAPAMVVTVPVGATFEGIDFTGNANLSLAGPSLVLTGPTPITVASTRGIFSMPQNVRLSTPSAVVSMTGIGPDPRAALIFSGQGVLTVSGGVVQLQGSAASIGIDSPIQEVAPTAFNVSGIAVSFSGGNITGPVAANSFMLTGSGSAPFGNAPVIIHGGSFYVNGASAATLGAVSLLGADTPDVIALDSPNSPLTITGPLNLGGSQHIFANGELFLRGPVTGGGPLRIDGPGVVEFDNATNNIPGGVNVERLATLRFGVSGAGNGIDHINTNFSTIDIGATVQHIPAVTCFGTFALTLGQGMLSVSRSLDFFNCTPVLTIPPFLSPAPGTEYTLVENLTGTAIPAVQSMQPGSIVMVNGTAMRVSYTAGASGRNLALVTVAGGTPSIARVDIASGDWQSLRMNGATNLSFGVRVFDNTGQPVVNAAVRFSSACGTFNGASFIDRTTDVSGSAQTLALFVAGPAPMLCPITATATGTGSASATFSAIIYDPAALKVTASPDFINTSINEAFSSTVRVTTGTGIPLRNVSFTAVLDSGSTSANPGLYTISGSSTNNDGYATFSGVASGTVGTYRFRIFFDADGPSVIVTVNQRNLSRDFEAQDMWWAGPGENGWGMAIVRHGEILFGTLFIYDSAGRPTWLVMPGGSWDATHVSFTGSLYTPTGTPFFAYDASRLAVGSPVGAATIRFDNDNEATIDYTVGGVVSRKHVIRQVFASGPRPPTSRSDLWWGGIAQNGWGLTILQQASTLFSVWYTYDANGAATWYVMPGGTWTSSDMYEGRVYRTTGSPWVGRPYDATQLRVFDAGAYAIRFTGDTATFEYVIDGRSGILPIVRQPF